jgi:AcrR family transcriptional regulator
VPPRLSLRERQRTAVREELRSSAIDAFLTRGYDETSISDIAEAAGISERTFYRYFATKELVALDWIDETATTVHAALRSESVETSPSMALCEALIAVQPLLDKNSPHDRIMPLIFSTPRLMSTYEEHCRQWAEAVAEVLAERLGTTVETDSRPRLWSTIGFAIATSVSREHALSPTGVSYSDALRDRFADAFEFFADHPRPRWGTVVSPRPAATAPDRTIASAAGSAGRAR